MFTTQKPTSDFRLGKLKQALPALALKHQKITLITPPSIFLLDERVFMSLGVLRVAAILESQGVHVAHLDLAGVKNYTDALETHLKNTDSSAVGITTTTPQLPLVVKIIAKIREVRPDLLIILGGPHITLTASALKLEKKAGRVHRAHQAYTKLEALANILVSGDGEKAIFVALGHDPEKFIDGDDMQGGLFMNNEFYDASPVPARHLVDVDSYHYEIEGHRATSLIAQLGCPFACGFCGGRNSKSLRVIRTRTTESIIAEMKMLYENHGFTGFMFYDDELNVNKGMISLMNEISNLQMRLGVEFRLRGFVKSELFTDEQAKAMYRAGFRWLLSGFESGAPRILKNINKKASLIDNTRTMEIAGRNNLKVKALMSVGHPGESEDTILQTQAWLTAVKPEDFDCTIITTYPGTPYYDEALPHPTDKGIWSYEYKVTGDKLHSYEIDYLLTMDHYKGDPRGGYRSYVFTDFLKATEIVSMRDWVESSVRAKLEIPFPQARPALRYEHSMGQGGNQNLPQNILRESTGLELNAISVADLQ